MQEGLGADGAGGEPHDDELIDEMERESFPASDAPSTWSGRDADGSSPVDAVDPVHDPIPEAGDPAAARIWDDAEPMDGQAPTG
jgi:hypothetical protein